MSDKFVFAPMLDPFSGREYTPAAVEIDTPAAPKPPKPEPEKPFRFAEGLTTKKSPSIDADTFDHAGLGSFQKDHHDGGDCDCHGTCTDCITKISKMNFAPGQKVRHIRSGQIYEMVKTYCVSADDCYCLMKKNGVETECLFYAGEVVAA